MGRVTQALRALPRHHRAVGPMAEPVGLQEMSWLALTAAGTGPYFTQISHSCPSACVGISPDACEDQCAIFTAFRWL